jgi:hypothetical protein
MIGEVVCVAMPEPIGREAFALLVSDGVTLIPTRVPTMS